MSQENVEIVRSVFRPGDPGRFFDLLDEEVEQVATAAPHIPEQTGVVHGKDAVVRAWRRFWSTWDDYAMALVEIIDAGEDRVLAESRRSSR